MNDLARWSALLAEATAEQKAQPERICDLCVRMLSISGAGISMVTDTGNRGVVCATDDRAGRIEDMQLTAGAGPCVDAVQSGSPVLIADLDDAGDVDFSRWLAFGAELRSVGVRAVFAFPLRIGAVTVGALDLYRDAPGGLDQAEVSAALLAADAAALALLYLKSDREDAFVADPQTKADFRLEVHQATGMVSVQLGIPIEEALLRLRARAFADGTTLTRLSAEVVARRVRFSTEDT